MKRIVKVEDIPTADVPAIIEKMHHCVQVLQYHLPPEVVDANPDCMRAITQLHMDIHAIREWFVQGW